MQFNLQHLWDNNKKVEVKLLDSSSILSSVYISHRHINIIIRTLLKSSYIYSYEGTLYVYLSVLMYASRAPF